MTVRAVRGHRGTGQFVFHDILQFDHNEPEDWNYYSTCLIRAIVIHLQMSLIIWIARLNSWLSQHSAASEEESRHCSGLFCSYHGGKHRC